MAEKKTCKGKAAPVKKAAAKKGEPEMKSALKVPNKKEVRMLASAAARAVVSANGAIGALRVALIARGDIKPNCPLCKKLAKADEIDSEFFAKVKEFGYIGK